MSHVFTLSKRKVSGREMRRAFNDQDAAIRGVVVPSLDAIAHNEQLTRQRVDQLEAWRNRPFLGRFLWIIAGK